MSFHAEGSGQSSYWPAFVDALTNVVINLLFLMALMTLAFFVVSAEVESAQKLAQAQAHKLAQASAPASAPKPAPAPRQPVAAPARPALTPWGPYEVLTIASSQATAPEAGGPAVQVLAIKAQGAGRQGTLLFPAQQLTAKLPEALLSPWTGSAQASALGWRLSIRMDAEQPQSKRSAYLRLMTVRNALLELGVGSESIVVQMQDNGRAGVDDRKVLVEAAPKSTSPSAPQSTPQSAPTTEVQ